MSLLEIKNVKKNFGGVEVLKDISLKVDKGEVLGIIGPSGSGKSTLLRCATGLETPDDGEINYDGTFGLVFQNFNLLDVYKRQVSRLHVPHGNSTHYLLQTDFRRLRRQRPLQDYAASWHG